MAHDTASLTSRHPAALLARLLWAVLCALGLAARAEAEETCRAEFQVGSSIWYAAQPHDRVSTTVASGCRAATGAQPQVLFFLKGERELIACDQALALPPAMRSELDAAQLEGLSVLPSRRPTLEATWRELVGKYSPALRCADGFQRMSDASSGVPSVWCRRHLTRRELCPKGTTFEEGGCASLACPADTLDLDRLTGGRLSGCFRCPVGQLDVEESVAWKGQSSWSSSGSGPVTAVLCRAPATESCPDRPRATPVPAATAPKDGP